MQRVKTSSAVTSRPAYTETGAPGYFTSGDAVAAIPATVPGAQWFNQVQEEILAVITAGGLTPDATKDTQLAAAIAQMIAAALVPKAPLASPALTGTPTAPTPPQFDVSQKLATTDFVHRNGLSGRMLYVIGSTTLTAADHAGASILTNTSGITLTLPLAATCPGGTRMEFVGNFPVTIVRQGTNAIFGNSSNASLTSVVLGDGDTLVLESNGVDWLIVGGSVALRYAGQFGASLGSSGYQRLPSGLIVQWGYKLTGTVTQTDVTFPIAFPAACLGTFPALYNDAAVTGGVISSSSNTTTGARFYGFGWGVSTSVRYLAIGI